MRFAKDILIATPPDQVFAYVSDFARHSEWGAHDLNVEASGPANVGSNFESTAKLFGTQKEHLTVTESSPGKRFAFESRGGLGVVLNAFDLEDAGGQTRLTKSQEFLKPTLLYRLTSLMVNSQRPKELQADVEKIKQRIEGGA